ncbi:hypothetical protein [Fictibacillus sp. JL2B1089]|uniref:hypothetical protein n=1 Tax=Fictibacillus sp. JL2B1089 TaxID=3399565 RepID=UPI003A8AFEF2
MCIECSIKKAIASLAGIEIKREVVGKVNKSLILQLKLAENEVDKIMSDTKATIASLPKDITEEEFVKTLSEKYEAKHNEAAAKVNEAFDQIFIAVGINDGETRSKRDTYKIDQTTGEVFREVEIFKDQVLH